MASAIVAEIALHGCDANILCPTVRSQKVRTATELSHSRQKVVCNNSYNGTVQLKSQTFLNVAQRQIYPHKKNIATYIKATYKHKKNNDRELKNKVRQHESAAAVSCVTREMLSDSTIL